MKRLRTTLKFLLITLAAMLAASAASAGQWQPWQPMGFIETLGDPALVVTGSNKQNVSVLVRGKDSHLYWNILHNGGWSGWTDLKAGVTSSPSCVSWSGNRIDCFYRGLDGSLEHIATTDAKNWSWDNQGGKIIGAPSATSNAPNYLTVYVRGTDNSMLLIHWDDDVGWSGWTRLGGALTTSPGCAGVPDSPGGKWAADCFVNGTDNHLYQWWAIDSWGSANDDINKNCGASLCTQGACTTCQPPRQDYGGSWAQISGLTLFQPSAYWVNPTAMNLFVTGLDNKLWHISWLALTQWGKWEQLDGTLTSGPSCASMGPGQIACAARASDGSVQIKFMW